MYQGTESENKAFLEGESKDTYGRGANRIRPGVTY